MKKRSKAAIKKAKARPRKALKPKRRSALKALSRPVAAPARETEVARLTRERDEALERQTATNKVLEVISGSPGNLDAAFETILANATRLCDASFGTLSLHEGDGLFRSVAMHNAPAAVVELRRRQPLMRPAPLVLLAKNKRSFQVLDATNQIDKQSDPDTATFVELSGARSAVVVPMIKSAELIGAIVVYRTKVRPFTGRQEEVLKNFAAQAVIAIENARLLNELRDRTSDLSQRTTDLTESLEQQTATAKVLRVISSSSVDIQPVLDTIVRTAAELCASEYAALFRLQDGNYHAAAWNNAAAEWVKYYSDHTISVDRGSLVGRTALERSVIHIVDCLADPEYAMHEAARLGRQRSMLGVPLLNNGIAIGVIGLLRTVVKPFTDKQIELVTAFADQAVIAIENARVLNELRLRTADLAESLEEQTATSEVLQIISSSPGDLEPVFEAMLEKAVRICDANFGNIFRWHDDALHLVAPYNIPAAFAEFRKRAPFRPDAENPIGRMVETRTVVHVADLAAESRYTDRLDEGMVAAVELGGVRTFVAVPMLKESELIGALIVYRQEVRPFTDKQIALVTNFAAQAVIAIENARLLNELRQRTADLSQRTTDLTESLEQQTATSEVLEVISRSAFDLRAVFETVAQSSVRLCGADRAFIFRFDGELLRMVVGYNSTPAFVEWVAKNPIRPGRHSGSARAALERKTIHITDVLTDSEYVYGAKDVEPIRTVLGVPILKGDDLLGVMMIYRLEVKPFTERQIALVETFADQAALAIENVRLLDELRERTQEVEKLNQQLEQRVTDQVGEIERMSRLRRFLPPQVADLIVASGTEQQLESHRREITALFCDLRGFTGFTESADAEDVMALLRDYHSAIGETIIKYSGTLERYAGDGVMVIFNDPVPVENPALQAVLMALEMRDAIGALTEKWSRLGHEIGFGIGIAHGYATLGTIGFEGRFDYAAIGTVSNVASRLCDEAKPAQILVSPRVLMAVKDAVTVEPVGEFELKGIRRPIAAYNVLAAKSAN
jgi:two-component system NtrC family sensor kinase